MNILCCQEHVELALDIIVDEFEVAPVIHNVIHNASEQNTCQYCKETAKYIVSSELES